MTTEYFEESLKEFSCHDCPLTCGGCAKPHFWIALPSVTAGWCFQPKLFVEALRQSIQTAFQLEPPAFYGVSRQMLHGVLESLQSIRCLALQ